VLNWLCWKLWMGASYLAKLEGRKEGGRRKELVSGRID
jgi:hypothetical protein